MANDNQALYSPSIVFHPGDTITEYLEFQDWSQRDLSRRSGLSPKVISEICNGKTPVTPMTALALEKVLQRPAHFWLNLQRIFDEAEARERTADKMLEWREWADRFPISEMKRFRWLDDDTGRNSSKVQALLEFFSVSSPDSWNSVWQASNVAYRQTRNFSASIEAIAAWARATELKAAELRTEPYSETKLRSLLPDLLSQTREPAEKFVEQVQAICATAGVAVVWVPELKKTGISGCARWLTDKKALIALTLRYKTDDQIWFTFFHEVGHILLHKRKQAFILDNADQYLTDKVVDPEMQSKEEEANRFASDTLIPPEKLSKFIRIRNYTEPSILGFASELNIGPGIVVGRLQHEGELKHFQGNGLKRKFNWRTRD